MEKSANAAPSIETAPDDLLGATRETDVAREASVTPGPRRLRASALLTGILRFRLELILIVALGGFALGSGMTGAPLVDWDEATYAEVAHEAIANHKYLDFTWNGQGYVKKPPLLFWALVGSFKVLGESEFAARLPSVAAGLATLLLIYLTAAGAAGRLAGTLAALAPLQFYFFIAPVAVFVLPGFEAIGIAGLAVIFGCAFAVATPWYVYEALYNPLFWTSFVGHETLARVAQHL